MITGESSALPRYVTFAQGKFYHILQPEKTLMPLSKTYCGKSVIFPHLNKVSGTWITRFRDGKPLPLPYHEVPVSYKVCKICKSRVPAQ